MNKREHTIEMQPLAGRPWHALVTCAAQFRGLASNLPNGSVATSACEAGSDPARRALSS
jgi:hypothetical protein